MTDPRSDPLLWAALDWLIEYWPDLLKAPLPGTPRPWRHAPLTPAQHAQRDADARAERTPDALGSAPTPLDLGALQTALDLLVQADDLAAAVAEHTTGLHSLPPPRHGDMDARPYLRYTTNHLTDDLAECGVHPTTAACETCTACRKCGPCECELATEWAREVA